LAGRGDKVPADVLLLLGRLTGATLKLDPGREFQAISANGSAILRFVGSISSVTTRSLSKPRAGNCLVCLIGRPVIRL